MGPQRWDAVHFALLAPNERDLSDDAVRMKRASLLTSRLKLDDNGTGGLPRPWG